MTKNIDYVLQAKTKSIGDETVLQPLPHRDFRFASPFIVIHHLPPKRYAPDSPPERIHPHPHRGFSPVTFMFQGEGYHRDSEGHSGVIREGEVQWMFAGRGLLHSEGPSEKLLKNGGTMEFVQIWVNVPAKYKMEEPFYQQASADRMPWLFEEEGIRLKLASGTYGNLVAPISSATPVTSIFGNISAGKSFSLDSKEGYWTLLYVLEGSVMVNDGRKIEGHHLVIFSKEGNKIDLRVNADTKILFLSGEPIDEPVAAKGNIVMNTEEEVAQAEKDYAEGKFGTLDF